MEVLLSETAACTSQNGFDVVLVPRPSGPSVCRLQYPRVIVLQATNAGARRPGYEAKIDVPKFDTTVSTAIYSQDH